MTTAVNLSIKWALGAAQDGCWMQTGHAQPRAALLGQEIGPVRSCMVSESSPVPDTELKGAGRRWRLPQPRWTCSETQTMHGKRAKRRAWRSGQGEEENHYLQWQLLFGLGACSQAGATLTCDFKHVLIPFGIFQLCQRHSRQRQLSLGKSKSRQCLHLLPSRRCSACFC